MNSRATHLTFTSAHVALRMLLLPQLSIDKPDSKNVTDYSFAFFKCNMNLLLKFPSDDCLTSIGNRKIYSESEDRSFKRRMQT